MPSATKTQYEHALHVRAMLLDKKQCIVVRKPSQHNVAHNFVASHAQGTVIFTFDDELTRLADYYTNTYPEVFASLLPAIRLPYPKMIISYSNLVLLANPEQEEKPGPYRYDLLWSNDDDTMISGLPILPIYMTDAAKQERVTPILPIVRLYAKPSNNDHGYMDTSFTDLIGHQSYPRPFDTPGMQMLAYVLGSMTGAKGDDDALLRAKATACTDANRHIGCIMPSWFPDSTELDYSKYTNLTREVIGHWRVSWGLLALLTLRDKLAHLTHHDRRGAGVPVPRNAPYYTEHRLTLKIPEPKALKLIKREAHLTGIKHRRHEVRGHWCIWTNKPECNHGWRELDPNHMVCVSCQGKRTWRRSHLRGDASLGYVRHLEYHVEHEG